MALCKLNDSIKVKVLSKKNEFINQEWTLEIALQTSEGKLVWVVAIPIGYKEVDTTQSVNKVFEWKRNLEDNEKGNTIFHLAGISIPYHLGMIAPMVKELKRLKIAIDKNTNFLFKGFGSQNYKRIMDFFPEDKKHPENTYVGQRELECGKGIKVCPKSVM